MQRVVFINIAWMKRYKGPSPTDPLIPGHFSYFKTGHGKLPIGHEQWNFLATNKVVYGYVPRDATIDISRFGASSDQSEIGGVLAVFVARDPIARKLKVVGWYKNATIRRKSTFEHRLGRRVIYTPISANAVDAKVLHVADRNIVVPSGKKEPGGMGQYPVWYANSHLKIVEQVLALVAGKAPSLQERAKPSPRGKARNPDPKTRLAVEKVAMDMAMKYFDNAVDVSRECNGWDVEAEADNGVSIYIEVKGLSGEAVNVELTPNEYEQMLKEKHRYYVFVVTSALTKTPRARTFSPGPENHRPGAPVWRSEFGEVLKIVPKTAARASL